MLIAHDTAEQKSKSWVGIWQGSHPQLAKTIMFKPCNLDAADFESVHAAIELKIDKDLKDSIKSGHLEEQLRYMLYFYKQFEDPPARHLVIVGSFDIDVFKTAVSLCQSYNTYFHHRKDALEGMECIVDLCRTERLPLDLSIPIKQRDINSSLVGALGYAVHGLSMACAAEIVGWRKTLEDLVNDLDATKVSKIINEYYNRDMGALADKVNGIIWGSQPVNSVPDNLFFRKLKGRT